MKHFSREGLASIAGTMLEIYDFVLYGAFAGLFAKLFFPKDLSYSTLFASLAIFSVGLIMRPLGGLIFGYVGDFCGRKTSLMITIFFMSCATLGIGILPTYETIGIAAPVILVICRMMQGLCAGAEYKGASIFMIEHCGKIKGQGFSGSIVTAAGGFGALLATLSAGLVLWLEINWRIPFIIGGLLGFCGMALRLSIRETVDFESVKNQIDPGILTYWKKFLATVGISSLQGVLAYTLFVYINIYLSQIIHLSIIDCNWITFLGIAFYTITTPLIGKLSDQAGYWRVIMIGVILTFTFAYPIFWAFNQDNLPLIILAQLILATLTAFCAGPTGAFLNNLFTAKVRCRGITFGYCLGSGLIGGFAPLLASYLTKLAGNILAPAICLMFYSVLGFIALMKSKS